MTSNRNAPEGPQVLLTAEQAQALSREISSLGSSQGPKIAREARVVLQNARHELFAQDWATGMSQEAAYKAAGYKPDRGAASRLSANVSIKGRVRELQSRAAADVVVSVASLTRELEHARLLALEKGQMSAAISAVLAKARIHGLLDPNPETILPSTDETEKGKTFAEMTAEERRQLARQIAYILGKVERDAQKGVT